MELIAKKKKREREGATRTVQSYKVNPSLLKKKWPPFVCTQSEMLRARFFFFFVLMS